LVWDKIRATRNRWYMKNLEFSLYLWKGAADPQGINDCGSKQSFPLNAKKETAHPTEKPVELGLHYIRNSTNPGDVVLDPMMGSGSAMVAAIQSGRRGIGIEIDPQWFEVACERVERALRSAPESAVSGGVAT
jgi:site-specific DNA-methyltransferase (adenine-specific)